VIQQVLDSGKLPPDLAENIDAIHHIGNFAGHPNKSKSTGEVVPVEPHEAQWNLASRRGSVDSIQASRRPVRRDDRQISIARLCHVAGGELEQIQFLLGHVSVQTTEKYLGCKQRIRNAVNDRIGIEPSS
jgi:hypothetical protein